jgi:hypothetical protein
MTRVVAAIFFIACVALQACAALRPMELGVCYYPGIVALGAALDA